MSARAANSCSCWNRWLLVAVALAWWVAATPAASAQDPPAPETPAATDPPADQPPAESPPAETPPAETPPAEPAPAAEQPAETPAEQPPADQPAAAPGGDFKALFAKFKELIVQLRTLQEKYKLTKPDERPGVEAEFNAALAQGNELTPQLQAAAEAEFKAAPNEDADCANFLASVVAAAAADDRYEEADRVAQILFDGNYPNKALCNEAGIAAFVLGDYDKAERLLKEGEAAGALNPLGKNYLGLVAEYRELSKQEQALRAAEATANDLPRVLLKTTKGDITIELFENEAPNTVANFISLVESGLYNGLTFHRVIGNFMAQGGDPKGDGSGGPGYEIACESYQPNHRNHFRGSLSMAHAGRDTGGSQFFLTFVPTAHLNGKHTVFGRVIEGMDVLPLLERTEGRPNAKPDKIIEATVLRKRDHEYKPVKMGGAEAAPTENPPASTP
ncbi:MAG: peptidylprolyl isomerase [Pirellulales bacterium]|nr:peptidylprolyl isomerase [Pirellulales bacterium]